MKFNNPYYNMSTKIQLLEKWILVHCYLYYYLNISIVDDFCYDSNSRQLAEYLHQFPQESNKSMYNYCFIDYDPSTGYDLINRLRYQDKEAIVKTANQLAYLVKVGR